jgi:carbon-monoxide dehydrogenase small subunit
MDRRVTAIALTVNGEAIRADVPARLHLADFLREHCGLTGTHLGCEHGVCGACTVRLDRAIVRSCLVLAVQTDGATVETIEGVSDSGEGQALQTAFAARNALQCGYCTPGMVITALHFLATAADPSDRVAIRQYLSGNYCRCTGYEAIVDAIASVAIASVGRP